MTSFAPEAPSQPAKNSGLIPVQVKPAAPQDENLDKILDKVEKEKEKAVIKKNLALLKKKDNKLDDNRVQPLAPTSMPSLYDNSNLFKRETVEQRLDKHNEVMGTGGGQQGVEEAPKQSWIQIKAAAMNERKINGAESQKTTLTKRKKAALQPKKSEEPAAGIKVAKNEDAKKAEGPSEPDGPGPVVNELPTARGKPQIEEERKSAQDDKAIPEAEKTKNEALKRKKTTKKKAK